MTFAFRINILHPNVFVLFVKNKQIIDEFRGLQIE